MKHISSRENPLYKRVARLVRGKRDLGADGTPKHHLVLEGVHLCQAWLEHIGAPELALFDHEGLHQDAELGQLAQAAGADRSVSCDSHLMRGLSHLEQGQSVYFVVAAPQTAVPPRIEESSLWLDRVQDPGNVGTLLRIAAAAGIKHVYLSSGCASAWSSKVLRAGQGAHFALSVYEHVDLVAESTRLAIPLLATALVDARPLYELALPAQCVWVFGNEGQGVDQSLLDAATARVYIPQEERVESLNVAAAAAICLFEQRRQQLYAA
jgi:TrmH family RNA methyltransferase